MISRSLDKRLADAAEQTGFIKALPLLRREARDCLFIAAADDERSQKPPLGASRIGGRPDLPRSVEWPHGLDKRGKPSGYATFLAQLNFAEVPKLNDLPLPRQGMLWIFARWWDDEVHLAAVHDPAPGKLARRTLPGTTSRDWGYHAPEAPDPTAIRFASGVSLPMCSSSFRKALQVQADEPEPNVFKFNAALQPHDRGGQLGGYSFVDEHDLYRTIAFRELGKPDHRFADYWDTMDDYERSLARPGPVDDDRLRAGFEKIRKHNESLRPRVQWIDDHRAELDREAASWQLLLSIRSHFAGLRLAEGYSLEIFIRHDALAGADFSGLRGEAPMVF